MRVPQIIVLVAVVGLGAFLYFTPYAPIAQETAVDSTTEEVSYDILNDITELKNELDSTTLGSISTQELLARSEDVETKVDALDSLITLFDNLRKPSGSAFHSLQKAKGTNNADHWTEAGERFLLNAKYMGDGAQKKNWFAQSRTCFEKAVEIAPEDLDIKVDLGVCLIEGASFLGTPPMEGIGMLKTVEQADPNNIKVLINLGYFAIKSGQYDKAEERFNKVIEIDGEYLDVHLYLADLHEKQKKTDLAIIDLENYKSKSDDSTRIKEVDNYIGELKKNI